MIGPDQNGRRANAFGMNVVGAIGMTSVQRLVRSESVEFQTEILDRRIRNSRLHVPDLSGRRVAIGLILLANPVVPLFQAVAAKCRHLDDADPGIDLARIREGSGPR